MDSIIKKIFRTRKFRSTAYGLVNKEAKKAKREIISFFDEHYFTRKLKQGPNPDERKNLFGFIGFEADEDPITPLRMVLENSFRVNKRPNAFTRTTWSHKVTVPTEEQLKTVSPMPWGVSMSWLDAVEYEGIPDLTSVPLMVFRVEGFVAVIVGDGENARRRIREELGKRGFATVRKPELPIPYEVANRPETPNEPGLVAVIARVEEPERQRDT